MKLSVIATFALLPSLAAASVFSTFLFFSDPSGKKIRNDRLDRSNLDLQRRHWTNADFSPSLRQRTSTSPTSIMISSETQNPSKSSPQIITINEPQELLTFLGEDDRLCVVKVWAKWCKSCKQIDLKFKMLADEHSDNVRFAELEFAGNEELCRGLRATKMPHFIIYKSMIRQDQFVCLPQDAKKLRYTIEELMEASPASPNELLP